MTTTTLSTSLRECVAPEGAQVVLTLPDAWAWDLWIADDGEIFHLYFLNAPHALGDPERRHRAARIGRATSRDLVEWTFQESPLIEPGAPGSFDDTATWTGCVVRGEDDVWRMFYTGSQFLHTEPSYANIESIGLAVSRDLVTWEKRPGPVTRADSQWYETYDGDPDGWKEEAWRDPWVFRDPDGDGWHMLVTARANHGALDDRGVVGHAWSPDLDTWEVRPPLSAPGAGFAHLEVPQVAQVDGHWHLLFSCGTDALSQKHAARRSDTGTWALAIESPTVAMDISAAEPLTSSACYSGRLIQDRAGKWVLLGFDSAPGRPFPGIVTDPVPVVARGHRLRTETAAYAAS